MNADALETWMASKIAGALKIDAGRVDHTSLFTSHGLDSLALLTLTGELAELLQRDLPMTLVWEFPTIELLARHLTASTDDIADGFIPRAPRDKPLPLSFSQERMWRLARKDEIGDSNLMVARFILNGSLHADALTQSFTELIRRHEILRTTFEVSNEHPVQIVHPPCDAIVSFLDLTEALDPAAEALRLVREDAAQPMHLNRGPLLRMTVLRLGPSEHRLVIIIHHLLFDGASMRTFYAELSAIYEAFCDGEAPALPEVALQMADFAAWQRNRLRWDGPVFQGHLAWWRDYWSGPLPPALKLPFRRARRITVPEETKSFIEWEVPPGLVDQIRSLGQREGATNYALLLTAFNVVLYQVTGQPEFVVHTYVSDRSRHSSKDSLGFFVNLLALRARLGGRAPFLEVLHQVRDMIQDVSVRQELAFEELTRALQAEGCKLPPVQVVFQLLSASGASLKLRALEIQRWKKGMSWQGQGFSMTVLEHSGGLRATITFDSELYEATAASEMMGRYAALLEKIVTEPNHPILPSALSR